MPDQGQADNQSCLIEEHVVPNQGQADNQPNSFEEQIVPNQDSYTEPQSKKKNSLK